MLYTLAKMRIASERMVSASSSSTSSVPLAGDCGCEEVVLPVVHVDQGAHLQHSTRDVLTQNWQFLLSQLGIHSENKTEDDAQSVCMRMVARMYGDEGVGPMTAEEGELIRKYFVSVALAES
jgi:hypothetical protein